MYVDYVHGTVKEARKTEISSVRQSINAFKIYGASHFR